jgi:hydroxylysine kinase
MIQYERYQRGSFPQVPVVSEIEPKHATSLTGNIFGLRVLHIIELNSYDDRNFHVRVSENSENENISKISPDGYVLKVLNSLDSEYENLVGRYSKNSF